MVTAIAALIAGPVAAAAAMYGQRGANRAAREASAVTGYNGLAQLLVAERDKAERDQAAAEQRADQLELDNARLRQMVRDLGGTP
ncbi:MULTISPECIES: hypothetical protein [unclassified Streptomyces]|uniref:hypothetical protein n=1 Tax=unclassified Streptomyces TaxID=2593676 RepID=UPI0036E290BA